MVSFIDSDAAVLGKRITIDASRVHRPAAARRPIEQDPDGAQAKVSIHAPVRERP
jgi:hypothetical protein